MIESLSFPGSSTPRLPDSSSRPHDPPQDRLEAFVVVVEEAAQGAAGLDEFVLAAVASTVGVVDIGEHGHH